jgi:ERCC4-type nuclease
MKIVHDQREKKPWSLPGVDTAAVHLETGDYTVEGFEDRFAVERKSLNDLATSLGANRSRFESEIRRAQSMDEFVVLVEGSRADIEDHQYYSNIHPNAVLGTTEKWPYKYGTLEFVWTGENEDGERVRDQAEARTHAAQECLRLLDRWYLMAASDLF